MQARLSRSSRFPVIRRGRSRQVPARGDEHRGAGNSEPRTLWADSMTSGLPRMRLPASYPRETRLGRQTRGRSPLHPYRQRTGGLGQECVAQVPVYRSPDGIRGQIGPPGSPFGPAPRNSCCGGRLRPAWSGPGRPDVVRRFPGRHCLHQADGPSPCALTRELRRSQNGRSIGAVGVHRAVRGVALRRVSDPPGVEKLGGASSSAPSSSAPSSSAHSAMPPLPATSATTLLSEGKDARPLNEEGTFLLIPGLERGEVHYGGIHLDLTEVRIQSRVDGKVGTEPVLQVQSSSVEEVRSISEGILEGDTVSLGDLDVLGASLERRGEARAPSIVRGPSNPRGDRISRFRQPRPSG